MIALALAAICIGIALYVNPKKIDEVTRPDESTSGNLAAIVITIAMLGISCIGLSALALGVRSLVSK